MMYIKAIQVEILSIATSTTNERALRCDIERVNHVAGS